MKKMPWDIIKSNNLEEFKLWVTNQGDEFDVNALYIYLSDEMWGDEEKSYLLIAALQNRSLSIAEYLISIEGINLNIKLRNGFHFLKQEPKFLSPLFLAMQMNAYKIMQLLISKGATINNADIIDYLIQNHEIDKLNFLIDNGLDVNIKVKEYGSLLNYASIHMEEKPKLNILFRNLIDKEADLSITGGDGKTAIHWLCKQKEYESFLEMGKVKGYTTKRDIPLNIIFPKDALGETILSILIDKEDFFNAKHLIAYALYNRAKLDLETKVKLKGIQDRINDLATDKGIASDKKFIQALITVVSTMLNSTGEEEGQTTTTETSGTPALGETKESED